MTKKIYQDISPAPRIDRVFMDYHATKDRKKRAELREEYKRLLEADRKQTGIRRYVNL